MYDADRAALAAGKVWRLTHALYGLKKSPKYWGDYFADVAQREWGLVRCQADRCLFLKPSSCGKKRATLVGVFVDDLLNAGDEAKEIKALIAKKWKIRDLGRAKEFVGCEIDHVDNGILLHQQRYVSKLIVRYGLSTKGVPTPLEAKANHLPQQAGSPFPRRIDDVMTICPTRSRAYSHPTSDKSPENYIKSCIQLYIAVGKTMHNKYAVGNPARPFRPEWEACPDSSSSSSPAV